MDRKIYHSEGSILNVMRLSFCSNDTFKPHKNIGRDEVIVVIQGRLEIQFDHGKSVMLEANDSNKWTLIPKDTTHNLKPLSETVVILEVIGGIHTSDATLYTDLLP